MKKHLKIAILSLSALLLGNQVTKAQKANNWCGTPYVDQLLQQQNPQYAATKAEFEKYVADYVKRTASTANQRTNGVQGRRIIPIVFHVIHQYGAENIPRANIVAQVHELNVGWNRMGTDSATVIIGNPPEEGGMAFAAFKAQGLVADCNVEFRLATKDPFGNPTDGIDRIPFFATYNNGGDTLDGSAVFAKSASYWDSKKYLNVWLVQSIFTPGPPGGEIEAFAVFPETRAQYPNIDGVISRADQLPSPPAPGASVPVSYRTLTHEIGHCFDLHHIWGDQVCGDDLVDDTPTAQNANQGGSYPNQTSDPLFPDIRDTACLYSAKNLVDSSYCIVDSAGTCKIVNSGDGTKYSHHGKSLWKQNAQNIGKINNQIAVGIYTQKGYFDYAMYLHRMDSVLDTLYYTKIDTLVLAPGVRTQQNLTMYKNIYIDKSGEMFNNYMDYSDQKDQNMFTLGQLARMNAVLDTNTGLRMDIVTEKNAVATGTDNSSWPSASLVGGIPNSFYYAFYGNSVAASPGPISFGYSINPQGYNPQPYSTDKIITCAGNTITFKDSSYNGHVQYRSWSFPGGTPATSTAPVVTVTYNTPGAYDVTLITGNTVGADTVTKKESIIVRGNSWYREINFADGFESNYYTDNGWTAIEDKVNFNDSVSWQRTTATAHSGNACMVLRNFDNHHISKYDIDELVTPPLEIRASDGNVYLNFYSSFAKKTTSCSAILDILYSVNCGQSWFSFAPTINANKLANAGVVAEDFIPTQSFLWTQQSFPIPSALSSYISGLPSNPKSASVMIKFRFQSSSPQGGFLAAAGANNLYIDDVSFSGTLGIEDLVSRNLNLAVYPNPANGQTNLTFNMESEARGTITLCDVTGRVLSIVADENLSAGEHQYQIANKYGAGIYMLKMKIGEYEAVRKVVFN